MQKQIKTIENINLFLNIHNYLPPTKSSPQRSPNLNQREKDHLISLPFLKGKKLIKCSSNKFFENIICKEKNADYSKNKLRKIWVNKLNFRTSRSNENSPNLKKNIFEGFVKKIEPIVFEKKKILKKVVNICDNQKENNEKTPEILDNINKKDLRPIKKDFLKKKEENTILKMKIENVEQKKLSTNNNENNFKPYKEINNEENNYLHKINKLQTKSKNLVIRNLQKPLPKQNFISIKQSDYGSWTIKSSITMQEDDI